MKERDYYHEQPKRCLIKIMVQSDCVNSLVTKEQTHPQELRLYLVHIICPCWWNCVVSNCLKFTNFISEYYQFSKLRSISGLFETFGQSKPVLYLQLILETAKEQKKVLIEERLLLFLLHVHKKMKLGIDLMTSCIF